MELRYFRTVLYFSNETRLIVAIESGEYAMLCLFVGSQLVEHDDTVQDLYQLGGSGGRILLRHVLTQRHCLLHMRVNSAQPKIEE